MLVPIGPFLRFPTARGGNQLPSDWPTQMPGVNLELWLDSRDFDGLAQDTRIGEAGVTPWVDKSGQTQGGARDGQQATAARRPWLQIAGSGFEAPNGEPSVKFITQTNTPSGPNPFNRLESSNPTGAGDPWEIESRGHTFCWLGRLYNMGTAGVIWSGLTDIRSQCTSRGGAVTTDARPFLRSNGTFHALNTGTIFASDPLPWGLTVLRFRTPAQGAGTVDFKRYALSTGWVNYSTAASATWDTTGEGGWSLSGNLSANVGQNMDLGTVLWYSDALTDAQLNTLVAWSLIYFGGE
jgi:hypothetical protein